MKTAINYLHEALTLCVQREDGRWLETIEHVANVVENVPGAVHLAELLHRAIETEMAVDLRAFHAASDEFFKRIELAAHTPRGSS